MVEFFTLQGQSPRPKSFSIFVPPAETTRGVTSLDNFVGNFLIDGDLVGRSEGSDLGNSETLVEGGEELRHHADKPYQFSLFHTRL